MDSNKMQYMKSKYELLGKIDNEAIEKKVDEIFINCFLEDNARFTDILIDAIEHEKKKKK